MSSIRKLLQHLKTRMPFQHKLTSAFSRPQRVRKYKDAEAVVPKPGQAGQEEDISYFQHEPMPKSEGTVILSDLTKQCVITQMMYHDYLAKMTNHYDDNPEFIDKCYDLLEMVTNDRPIRKKFLLDICPELFTYEVLEMESPIPLEEKYKNLHLGGNKEEQEFLEDHTKGITLYDPVKGGETPKTKPKQLEGEESQIGNFTIRDLEDPSTLQLPEFLTAEEINRRHIYIWQQTKKTFSESAAFIDEMADKLGNVHSALDYIVLKGDKRNKKEQKVIDGMEHIGALMQNHEIYKQRVQKYFMMNQILPFPMPKYLRKLYLKKMEEAYTYHHVSDMAQVMGVPDKSEEYEMEVKLKQQRAMDLQSLSEKDRAEAVKMIEEKGDELITRRDLNAKDNALISKLNILANTVEVEKPKDPVPDFSKEFDPEALRVKLRDQMTVSLEPGVLTGDDIIKMLYLNNAQPEKFDLKYLAEATNMHPEKLRNILIHLDFPVIMEGQAVGKLTFVEIPRKKGIVDLEEENLRRFREAQT